MKFRLLGLVLVVAAILMYVGVALPSRQAAAGTGDAYRRARDRRREAVSRLARAERARNAVVAASAPVPGLDPIVGLRRSVVASLERAGVSNVRLSVTRGRSPVAARVHVAAEGSFADVVRLSGHLVRAGSDLVLDRVRISPSTAGVALDVDAFSLEKRP